MIYTLKKLPYGIYFSALVFLIISSSAVLFNAHHMLAPDSFSENMREDAMLLKDPYQNNTIIFYSCTGAPAIQAQSIAYLQQCNQLRNASIKKIAVMDTNACGYPKIAQSTSSITLNEHLFPLIKNTSFRDFSAASDTALKQASWSAVSTKVIFKKTVQWY